MNILSIETSCDETAAAVVRDGRDVLSNVINSQIEEHKKFGGVVPEVASRRHIENINAVVQRAVSGAGLTLAEIDAVAVTNTPGLVGALLVGVSFAKGLAFSLGVPLIPVNHIHAHIMANVTEHNVAPPFLCLVASGGHSHIINVKDYATFEVIARTRDDAAGEAYDKVARLLELGYPGGPVIAECAKCGDREFIKFPRVKMPDSFDFSFSGVKTAVINYVSNAKQRGEEINKADICASFQYAVNSALAGHLIDAAKRLDCRVITLAGGVASNAGLRRTVKELAEENNMEFYCPSPALCTDNAVMVGTMAYFNFQNGITADMSLNAAAQYKN